MTLLRYLVNRSALLLRTVTLAHTGSDATIRTPGHHGPRPLMMPVATTRPVWLKFSQTAGQASLVPCVMAMHRSVEMHVARRAGVALTIQQLREAAVYSVTYDESVGRHVHEVFAPFGITYQPISGVS
ncbi:hypothetical protein [Kribbella steppae]|nr:hypothetical protein [Kribbella steppae]